ncbi:hypothetical protein AAFC00_000547 [Neodothiora populina]|uniref:Uncharacterized protein n=1 Tax=Neodothiora populina TaxID=2781224 RepID=A0ABR3PEE6_9PEZI
MPPRIAPSVLPQAYQCPSCVARRAFSRSAAVAQIGPESPRYIDIPQPPQQTTPDKPRIRGALPVPRDIFAGSAPGRGIDKADPENVLKATQEPSPTTKDRRVTCSSRSDAERLAWKERMAEQRRKNLREGLSALKDRKVRTDTRLAAQGKRRQEEREAMLHAAERDDERLTAPTVELELLRLLEKNAVPAADRSARLAEMRERVARKEAARKEERADSLHTLYINARSFIINEAQLASAIDAEFGTVDAPRVFDYKHEIPSIWANGKPDTVQDMLNRASGQQTTRGAIGSALRGRSSSITKERVTRIGEELTGGKTDPEIA